MGSGKFNGIFLDFCGPSIEFSKSSKPVPATIIFFKTRQAQIQTFPCGMIFNDVVSDYFQKQNGMLESPYHLGNIENGVNRLSKVKYSQSDLTA